MACTSWSPRCPSGHGHLGHLLRTQRRQLALHREEPGGPLATPSHPQAHTGRLSPARRRSSPDAEGRQTLSKTFQDLRFAHHSFQKYAGGLLPAIRGAQEPGCGDPRRAHFVLGVWGQRGLGGYSARRGSVRRDGGTIRRSPPAATARFRRY